MLRHHASMAILLLFAFAFVGFDPDRGIGAVVLTNSSHDTDDIGLHLINSNIPLSEPPAKRTEVMTVPGIEIACSA